MARFKHVNREQGLFLAISFSKQIVPGTFEHAIDYIVDNKINFERLTERYANDETGAPAYSPQVLLKIVLLSYSRGIVSSRKIEQLCRENIIFMALTGGLAPDFTTIACFVRSLHSEIRDIFLNVLLVCDELDLLGGTEFALDGCKITSNASKEMSGTFSDLEKKKEKLQKNIEYLMKTHKENDGGKQPKTEKETLKRRIDKIAKKVKKIENFLSDNEPKVKSRKGERQSNITDNESAKMKTSHGVIQGYNGMALSDSKHQVIVNAEAFGEGHEHYLLQPMIEGTKNALKMIGRGENYLKEKRVIADTGSFTEDNLKYLSDESVNAYIPDQQFRKRDIRFNDAKRHKTSEPKSKERHIKDDFVYNKRKDTFTCPAGNDLQFSVRQIFNNTAGRKYISKRSFCQPCSLKKKCIKSDKSRYRTLYVIETFYNRSYSDEMRRKIDTSEGREIYSRRMGIIEPVFGNICSAKGLDVFTLRSRIKVNVQWLLYCMVHNIEKIKNFGRYERLAGLNV